MTSEQKISPTGGTRGRSVEKRAIPAQIVERGTCADFARSSRLEWIETNGTGGFAMGTVAGVNTRRYHGLLVAALKPPVDRFVALSKVEETITIDGHDHDLAPTHYPGALPPQRHRALQS